MTAKVRVRPGRRPRAKPAGGVLSEAVAASRSLAETLRRLGLPDTGSTRAALKRWIDDDGLATAHFLGRAHRGGTPGPSSVRPAAEVLVERRDGRRTRTHLLRRALSESGVPDRCAECGTPPVWLGMPMTLEVDHVNGDRCDDRIGNLRLLCPNCHASTSTWCRGTSPRR